MHSCFLIRIPTFVMFFLLLKILLILLLVFLFYFEYFYTRRFRALRTLPSSSSGGVRGVLHPPIPPPPPPPYPLHKVLKKKNNIYYRGPPCTPPPPPRCHPYPLHRVKKNGCHLGFWSWCKIVQVDVKNVMKDREGKGREGHQAQFFMWIESVTYWNICILWVSFLKLLYLIVLHI